jgi:hypothetical protein
MEAQPEPLQCPATSGVVTFPDGQPIVFSLAQGSHTLEMSNSGLDADIGTNLDYIQLIRIDNQ